MITDFKITFRHWHYLYEKPKKEYFYLNISLFLINKQFFSDTFLCTPYFIISHEISLFLNSKCYMFPSTLRDAA